MTGGAVRGVGTVRAHEHATLPAPRYSGHALGVAADLFRAIGDHERLRLLTILSGGERCVSELAETVGASLSTVSQRLRVLRGVGLLERRREGKHVYYSLADEHVAGLIANALAHASEDDRR